MSVTSKQSWKVATNGQFKMPYTVFMGDFQTSVATPDVDLDFQAGLKAHGSKRSVIDDFTDFQGL